MATPQGRPAPEPKRSGQPHEQRSPRLGGRERRLAERVVPFETAMDYVLKKNAELYRRLK